MIRHFVHLRFDQTTSDVTKAELFRDLAGLKTQIDGVEDFQVRRNISVETALVRGFSDMFWFDFRDPAVREAYLDDPAHKVIGARLVDALQGGADGVFVCDIEV